MTAQPVNLKAPNGKEYLQPVGIFIDNEFVQATDPKSTITSIDPASVFLPPTCPHC